MIVALLSGSAFGLDCRPFKIYPGIELRTPASEEKYVGKTTDELIQKISKLPGHENFSTLYKERKRKNLVFPSTEAYTLECIYSYVSFDFAKDGEMDWQIATPDQIFDRPIPKDRDWDNDGIENIFDENPFEPDIFAARTPFTEKLPAHLRLHPEEGHSINRQQQELFAKCNILVVNHTDQHAENTLKSLHEICTKISNPTFMKANSPLILYAFAGHTVVDNMNANFFPQLNFMSIGGQSTTLKDHSDIKVLGTLAHELGHYFFFNHLEAEDLVTLARTYGHWSISESTEKRSKFDIAFQNSRPNIEKGFYPSEYSKANIHEWFSEVFALYLKKGMKLEVSPSIELPEELESWLSKKLPLMSQ